MDSDEAVNLSDVAGADIDRVTTHNNTKLTTTDIPR